MKKAVMAAMALAVIVGSANAATQRVQTSPFTDNMTVYLHDFVGAGQVHIDYQSQNDVNISGPIGLDGGVQNFEIHVSSMNGFENGYPTMTVSLPSTGTSCKLQFVDGPWAYLAYRYGVSPTCAHIKAGEVIGDGQYAYHLDLTYVK